MLFVIVIVMIVLVILILILWKMSYSVKETRTALLLICNVIKNSGLIGSIIGGALEALVRTFVWF